MPEPAPGAATVGATLDAVAIGDARATLRRRLDERQRRESDYLLCHVLDCERAHLYAHPEAPLAPAQRRRLEELLIERFAHGKPLAYLTGVCEFFSIEFEVSPEVMIPRPETETLVETAIASAPERARVADLGVGCGAVAVAFADARPDATVTACDVNPAALAIAERNAARCGVAVSFFESDWFAQLPGGRFDLIVSNPPYVAAGDPDLDPSVAAHEPHVAVFAADGGLACLRQIIAEAPARLAAGGALALEHGHAQDEAVAELMRAAGFGEVRCVRDFAARPRVTVGIAGGVIGSRAVSLTAP